MKNLLKAILQKILGFNNYLYFFSIYIINTLKWNRKEKDFLLFCQRIPDSGIILDIGANIGAMTVHLAKKHPSASVYAFEPIPHNFHTLEKICRHYRLKNVHLIKTALGNTSGEVEMVMPIEKTARLQGLSHVMHESIQEMNDGEKFQVPLTTLDDFIESSGITEPITAMKLDVENFEYFVLQGAQKIIEQYRPMIYCELWNNENRTHCFRLMNELGYKIMVTDGKELCDFDPLKHSTQNFFFIP